MSQTIDNHWHLCVVDTDYLISDEYPYPIKRIGSDRVITESFNNQGYVVCSMNGKGYKKHRIIAEQFIDNDDPDTNTEVDHINHDRSDNHISNLRWVTRSENTRNKASHHGVGYEYHDELPDDAIVVNDYGNHNFEFYYYSESTDEFYYYNGRHYRILHVNEDKQHDGFLFVYMRDTNDKQVKVCLNKFKRLYDIEF